jgi:hypothetical protein
MFKSRQHVHLHPQSYSLHIESSGGVELIQMATSLALLLVSISYTDLLPPSHAILTWPYFVVIFFFLPFISF